MSFLATTAILLLIWVSVVGLVRRNLRQRDDARKFRAIFETEASDLIGKAEFPDAHARQLLVMSKIPGGWLTRFMLFAILKQTILGRPVRRAAGPQIDQVPRQLQAKYVIALLAFILSDSYRCALFGRVIRGIYPWLRQALAEVKPDIHAHATRSVADQIGQARPPRRFGVEPELLCV